MRRNGIRPILIVIIVALILCAIVRIAKRNYFDAKKLIEAIRNEDIYTAKEIIDKNPESVNTYPLFTKFRWDKILDFRVFYPLTEACFTGNIDMIELLIENGADVNSNDGYTPLSVTYRYKVDNWYDISQILIENGASLEYTTQDSGIYSSVLLDIVQERHPNSALGNIPDMPDDEKEVSKAFNHALENVNHDNVQWTWVLRYSVSNDRIKIVKLLLDQEYCTANDTAGELTMLMFAARDSNAEMVQLLLDYGADKNIKDPDGKTAIDYAIERDKKDIIALLQD